MRTTTNLWVYYYFLYRKYAYSPVVAAYTATKSCEWWDAKAAGKKTGFFPFMF